MSETTTIEVKKATTFVRLKKYKDTFKMSYDQLLNHFMDQLGLASAEDIRLHEKNFTDKFGKEADAAPAEDDVTIGTAHAENMAKGSS